MTTSSLLPTSNVVVDGAENPQATSLQLDLDQKQVADAGALFVLKSKGMCISKYTYSLSCFVSHKLFMTLCLMISSVLTLSFFFSHERTKNSMLIINLCDLSPPPIPCS